MGLRKLAKDANSRDEHCPAVYADEDNPLAMLAQGKLLEADTIANLENHAADETAVRIPAETMVRAVEQYLAIYGRPA